MIGGWCVVESFVLANVCGVSIVVNDCIGICALMCRDVFSIVYGNIWSMGFDDSEMFNLWMILKDVETFVVFELGKFDFVECTSSTVSNESYEETWW